MDLQSGYDIIACIASGDVCTQDVPPLISELFSNSYFFDAWNKSDEELAKETSEYGRLNPISSMLILTDTIIGWKVLAMYAPPNDLIKIVGSGLVTNRVLNLIISILYQRGDEKLLRDVEAATIWENADVVLRVVMNHVNDIETLKSLYETSEEHRIVLDNPEVLQKLMKRAISEEETILEYDESAPVPMRNFQDYFRWYVTHFYSLYCDYKNNRECLYSALKLDDVVMFEKIDRAGLIGGIHEDVIDNNAVKIAQYLINARRDEWEVIFLNIAFGTVSELRQSFGRLDSPPSADEVSEMAATLYGRRNIDLEIKKFVMDIVTLTISLGAKIDVANFIETAVSRLGSPESPDTHTSWLVDVALLILNTDKRTTFSPQTESLLLIGLELLTYAQYRIGNPGAYRGSIHVMIQVIPHDANRGSLKRFIFFLLPYFDEESAEEVRRRYPDLLEEALNEYKQSEMASVSIPLLR